MVGTQAKQSFETGSKVEHNLLIYGGLGDLVNKKVLPALATLPGNSHQTRWLTRPM